MNVKNLRISCFHYVVVVVFVMCRSGWSLIKLYIYTHIYISNSFWYICTQRQSYLLKVRKTLFLLRTWWFVVCLIWQIMLPSNPDLKANRKKKRLKCNSITNKSTSLSSIIRKYCWICLYDWIHVSVLVGMCASPTNTQTLTSTSTCADFNFKAERQSS